MVEEFLVLVKQRLALGCISDNEGDSGGEFDGRGKAASASADNA
jgi:hypothetical protein